MSIIFESLANSRGFEQLLPNMRITGGLLRSANTKPSRRELHPIPAQGRCHPISFRRPRVWKWVPSRVCLLRYHHSPQKPQGALPALGSWGRQRQAGESGFGSSLQAGTQAEVRDQQRLGSPPPLSRGQALRGNDASTPDARQSDFSFIHGGSDIAGRCELAMTGATE